MGLFTNLSTFGALGFLGTALFVVTYALLQSGAIRGSGYVYPGLNFLAALLVLLGLFGNPNPSVAALQIIWMALSLFGLLRVYLINSRLNFSDEEMTLIAYGLPRMPRPIARKLLNRGEWMDAGEGTVLTTENKAVTHLHYILHGAADVASGGTVIAELTQGFVGEMNVMEAAPASATVTVNRPSRVFAISGTSLRGLVETDQEFASSLTAHLAQSTKDKLVEANRKLAEPS